LDCFPKEALAARQASLFQGWMRGDEEMQRLSQHFI